VEYFPEGGRRHGLQAFANIISPPGACNTRENHLTPHGSGDAGPARKPFVRRKAWMAPHPLQPIVRPRLRPASAPFHFSQLLLVNHFTLYLFSIAEPGAGASLESAPPPHLPLHALRPKWMPSSATTSSNVSGAAKMPSQTLAGAAHPWDRAANVHWTLAVGPGSQR
jgi:hypothetical protein